LDHCQYLLVAVVIGSKILLSTEESWLVKEDVGQDTDRAEAGRLGLLEEGGKTSISTRKRVRE